jgi:signal peptidase II
LKQLPLVPVLAFATLALDQFTKWLVVSNMQIDQSIFPIPPLSGLFALTYVTNSGIAFGLFKEAGTFFMFLAVIVIAALLFSLRKLPAHQRLVRIALGLALGGAIGNLIDRVRLGYVVDFIDFRFWPVLNIADIAIMTGVTLLAISLWYEGRTDARPQRPDTSSEQFPG